MGCQCEHEPTVENATRFTSHFRENQIWMRTPSQIGWLRFPDESFQYEIGHFSWTLRSLTALEATTMVDRKLLRYFLSDLDVSIKKIKVFIKLGLVNRILNNTEMSGVFCRISTSYSHGHDKALEIQEFTATCHEPQPNILSREKIGLRRHKLAWPHQCVRIFQICATHKQQWNENASSLRSVFEWMRTSQRKKLFMSTQRSPNKHSTPGTLLHSSDCWVTFNAWAWFTSLSIWMLCTSKTRILHILLQCETMNIDNSFHTFPALKKHCPFVSVVPAHAHLAPLMDDFECVHPMQLCYFYEFKSSASCLSRKIVFPWNLPATIKVLRCANEKCWHTNWIEPPTCCGTVCDFSLDSLPSIHGRVTLCAATFRCQ